MSDCPDCPHTYDQHNDLRGCAGEDGKCDCLLSKFALDAKASLDDPDEVD